MSLFHVCGFIATMRSTPPRRRGHPCSHTCTSYHVGRPWMLDGKMLRGLIGTPMRMMDFAKSVLADAEPEPLTFANLTTKSLTASSLFTPGLLRRDGPSLPRQERHRTRGLGLTLCHLGHGCRLTGIKPEASDQL